MKRLFTIIIALLAWTSVFAVEAQDRQADSLTFVGADWHWTQLARGAEAGYAQLPIFKSTQYISVVRYPARKLKTLFISSPMSEAATTDSIAIRNGAIAAVNGSYFNMKTLEHVTFFSLNHKVLANTSNSELFRCNGVVAVRGRHGLEVMKYDASQEKRYQRKYKAAMVSGPVLLLDGKTCEFASDRKFTQKRHPRTFVGATSDGWVYFVVVDGRFPGQGEGATIPELALIARWFGMSNAINLDGGGSATVWTSELGVLNHPYDNKTFDHKGLRKVPNIIIAK